MTATASLLATTSASVLTKGLLATGNTGGAADGAVPIASFLDLAPPPAARPVLAGDGSGLPVDAGGDTLDPTGTDDPDAAALAWLMPATMPQAVPQTPVPAQAVDAAGPEPVGVPGLPAATASPVSLAAAPAKTPESGPADATIVSAAAPPPSAPRLPRIDRQRDRPETPVTVVTTPIVGAKPAAASPVEERIAAPRSDTLPGSTAITPSALSAMAATVGPVAQRSMPRLARSAVAPSSVDLPQMAGAPTILASATPSSSAIRPDEMPGPIVTTTVPLPGPEATGTAPAIETPAATPSRAVTIAHDAAVRAADTTRQPVSNAAPAPGAVPVVGAGPVASAAQTFAEAIHRSLGDDARDPGTLSPAGTVDLSHIAAPAVTAAQGGAIDMRQHAWPEAMIAQIERLRDMADANDTSIRLIPDALGAIDISLRRDGDAVQVTMHAEQAQTRALIAEAQPRLHDMAEQRGLKLQTSTGGGGNAASQQQQQQARQQQQAAPPSAFAHQQHRDPPDDARLA